MSSKSIIFFTSSQQLCQTIIYLHECLLTGYSRNRLWLILKIIICIYIKNIWRVPDVVVPFLLNKSQEMQKEGKVFLEDIVSKYYYSIGIQFHNNIGFNCSSFNTRNLFIMLRFVSDWYRYKFCKKKFHQYFHTLQAMYMN